MSSDRLFDCYDRLRLVELVKSHRALYDHEDPNYKSFAYTKEIWEHISQTFMEEGRGEIEGVMLKQCWKNIKDCFAKILKKKKKHTKWIFFNKVKFIEPFLKQKVSLEEGDAEGLDAASQGESTRHISVQDRLRFIELVKSFPEIYSSANPDYKSIHKLWERIAEIMTEEGRGTLNVHAWKSVWKNLKDSQKKRIRNKVKTNRWVYKDALSFLEPHIDMNVSGGSRGNEEGPSQSESSDNEGETVELEDTDEDHADHQRSMNTSTGRKRHLATEPSPPIPELRDRERATDSPSFDQSAQDSNHSFSLKAEHIPSQTDRKWCRHSEEESAVLNSAEHMLMHSCALRMMKLPQHLRSYLQLQMQQLMFNAENPHCQVPILMLPASPGLPSQSGMQLGQPMQAGFPSQSGMLPSQSCLQADNEGDLLEQKHNPFC